MTKQWGATQRKEEEITCSLVKAPNIYLELTARHKLDILMDEYRSREWIGYLVGEIAKKTEDFFIEDIAVPPHKESVYASAEAEPFNIPDRCVGVIHSHHSMGAFHSATDKGHVDKNFPVSIVVARGTDGELTFNTTCVKDTPCGKTLSLDGEVHYLQPEPDFNAEAWLKEVKKNIDLGEGKYTYGSPKTIIPQKGHPQSFSYGRYVEAATQGRILPETTVPKAVKSVNMDEITAMQERIKETRGVELSRSEVEDIFLGMPGASGWIS